MCDIPPHVINILESEYVLFADPPKYYNDVYNIQWLGRFENAFLLFCFPNMRAFVLYLMLTVLAKYQEKLLELVMEIKSKSMDLSPSFWVLDIRLRHVEPGNVKNT